MIAVIFTLVGAVGAISVMSAWLPYHDDRIRTKALRRPPKGVAVLDFRPFVNAMAKIAKLYTETIDPAITAAGERVADDAEHYANRDGAS